MSLFESQKLEGKEEIFFFPLKPEPIFFSLKLYKKKVLSQCGLGYSLQIFVKMLNLKI